jgi:hypothetical protein
MEKINEIHSVSDIDFKQFLNSKKQEIIDKNIYKQ